MDCDGAPIASPTDCNIATPQSGSAFLFTLGALVILSGLAAGLILSSPQTVLTTLAGANEMRAYYLALSGLNFWSNGRTGVFALGNDSITLTQSTPDANGYTTVTSIGTVRLAKGCEANVRITAKRQTTAIITFANDIDDFKMPTLDKTTNDTNAVIVFGADASNAPASMDYADWVSLLAQNSLRYPTGWLRLGGDTAATSGAVWYSGDKSSCNAGKCSLGEGLRAYFDFTFESYDASPDSKEKGDGFTFAVVTAENDPDTAAGGPGEYIGYAGPGPGGQGIKAPKIAVEVDTYPNKGNAAADTRNSRRDRSDANHLAVVCWGAADTLYDDNVHGVGTDPQNPATTSQGYYEQAAPTGGPNWLEDGMQHAMRVEIHRESHDDKGCYTVRVWIDPTEDGRDDVTADYAMPPLVTSTVYLEQADHNRLDTVYFGWTESTGAETQTVAIYDFALAFRH